MARRSPGQTPMLSGAVRATGAVVYSSGIVAPGVFAGEDLGFADEAAQAMEALLAALAGVGAGPADVVKVEAFLADAADLPAWNEVFTSIWPEPGPARTSLIVAFALGGVRVELQAVAVIEEG